MRAKHRVTLINQVVLRLQSFLFPLNIIILTSLLGSHRRTELIQAEQFLIALKVRAQVKFNSSMKTTMILG